MENKPLDKPKLVSYPAIWLKKQLDFWCSRGIINEAQKESIKNLYIWPQDASPSFSRSPLKLINVIEIIGALLIGIGVISLVAFNWPKIPSLTKLLIIVFSIISIHTAGFLIIKRKTNIKNTGFVMIFLANLFYGAGIWLVAQTYHIHSNFATGIFLWAIGTIPFAYVLKSKLNYFLAITLFILWTLAESIGYQKPHLVFLVILLGLMLPLAYHLKSKTGLAICIITGAFWLLMNNIFWFAANFSILLFLPFAFYAVLLIIVSNVHLLSTEFKLYRIVYLYSGIAIFSIVIFLLPFFGVFQKIYEPHHANVLSLSFWICNVILLSGIIISIFLSNKTESKGTVLVVKQMVPVLSLSSLYILFMPILKASLISSLLPIVFIVLSYWHYTKSRILINIGLFYFLLWLPSCLLIWKQPFMLFLILLAYGAFCYLLGWTYIIKFQDDLFGIIYKAFGLTVTFFSFYIFSFSSISSYFSHTYSFPGNFEFWYILILLYFAMAAMYSRYIFSFSYPVVQKGLLVEERFMSIVLPVLPLIFFIIISNRISGAGYTFFANFSFICLLIVFLAAGYRRQQVYLKVITFIFLILLVATRYIEMEWSLFYKAILFIITGIVVLVIGVVFEKHKDKVAVIEK